MSDKQISDVAAHPEGQHYLALTTEGTVYSWGNGEGGRLGHGDNNFQEYPTLIEALLGHSIVRIACGSSYRLERNFRSSYFVYIEYMIENSPFIVPQLPLRVNY